MSARSPFDWNTGKPSILWTPEGERAARRLAGNKTGKVLDSQGRAQVDLAPNSKGSIQIYSQADSDRNQRIKRGTSA